MDESHMKESMRLYAMNSHQAQIRIDKTTTVKWRTQKDVPLVKVDQIKPQESQG